MKEKKYFNLRNINYLYLSIIFLSVLITMGFHEFGHFISGKVLGYKMAMNLNRTVIVEGSYQKDFHQLIVYAGGSIFSILQILFFGFILKNATKIYPFILAPIVLRIWPYFVSPVKYQDEGIISNLYWNSPWILPFISCVLFLIAGIYFTKRNKISFKKAIGHVLLIIVFFLIVLAINNHFFNF